MKARSTIIGRLTADAENFINKSKKKQCKFSLAVNNNNKEGIYITCFINYHLSEEQLKFYKKGCLCYCEGKYNLSIKQEPFDIYCNRTLSISRFFSVDFKSPFSQDHTIEIVGYILDYKIENDNIVIRICEKNIIRNGMTDNPIYTCIVPKYRIKKLTVLEEDTIIFVKGLYSEKIENEISSIFIDRKIDVNDIEIIEQPTIIMSIGGKVKKL